MGVYCTSREPAAKAGQNTTPEYPSRQQARFDRNSGGGSNDQYSNEPQRPMIDQIIEDVFGSSGQIFFGSNSSLGCYWAVIIQNNHVRLSGKVQVLCNTLCLFPKLKYRLVSCTSYHRCHDVSQSEVKFCYPPADNIHRTPACYQISKYPDNSDYFRINVFLI